MSRSRKFFGFVEFPTLQNYAMVHSQSIGNNFSENFKHEYSFENLMGMSTKNWNFQN
jgi:hypothetical protein